VTQSIQKQPNQLLRDTFPLLVVFLFCTSSAILEVIPYVGRLRLLLILGSIGLLIVFASGQGIKVLKFSTGKTLAIFTLWFIACVPFGLWPGGSVGVFTEFWIKSALIFLLTAGLLTTLPQAKKLFHAIAYAIGLAAIITVLRNDRWDGRLVLADTRYANPNDLAWSLLVGLTFIGFLYMRGSRFQKLLSVIMAAAALLALSRTGSRAGLIGVVVLLAVVFAQASRATRIKLAVSLPAVLILVLVIVPSGLRERYTTFFVPENFDPSQEERTANVQALGSADARMQLIKDGLRVTAMHPLLGVGPGNFPVAQSELALAQGKKAIWHVTHNTYLQLSTEMGIPGLVIYLVFVYQVFKMLNSIIRNRFPGPEWRDLRLLSISLRAALIVFLVFAFFDNLAFNVDVPVLAGLATALWFMAQKQRAIDKGVSRSEAVAEPRLEPDLEPVVVGQY
jgi:O-antigen ligase